MLSFHAIVGLCSIYLLLAMQIMNGRKIAFLFNKVTFRLSLKVQIFRMLTALCSIFRYTQVNFRLKLIAKFLKLNYSNKMSKRHGDSRLFLLGSVPTQVDKHIVTSKLPTNKQMLFAFIAKKEEEFGKIKTKKVMFRAALSIAMEEILPIYRKARIPAKQPKKIAQDILKYYNSMQNLMKTKKEKREIGITKERIETFKKSLQETMVCWPKDVWSKVTNSEDKAFLLSMQGDRTASIGGKDMKTYKLEKKTKKEKRSSISIETI